MIRTVIISADQVTCSRLEALHGERASLELAATADGEGGTLATVRLPLSLT